MGDRPRYRHSAAPPPPARHPACLRRTGVPPPAARPQTPAAPVLPRTYAAADPRASMRHRCRVGRSAARVAPAALRAPSHAAASRPWWKRCALASSFADSSAALESAFNLEFKLAHQLIVGYGVGTILDPG